MQTLASESQWVKNFSGALSISWFGTLNEMVCTSQKPAAQACAGARVADEGKQTFATAPAMRPDLIGICRKQKVLELFVPRLHTLLICTHEAMARFDVVVDFRVLNLVAPQALQA